MKYLDLIFIFSGIVAVTCSVSIGQVFPKFQVALLGSTVKVSCDSAIQTTWIKDHSEVVDLQEGDDLLIHNANEGHSGIYTCQGTTTSGEYFSSTAEVIVASNNSQNNYVFTNLPMVCEREKTI